MNLLGQNIGQNYRGIINLGATINSPLSTTLQAVTDGMGNNSPLQLSTTQVSVVAARNYNTFYVGGSPAAAVKIGQSADPTVDGLILGINGSVGDFYGIGFGSTYTMPTAVLSFNRFSRQGFIHDSLFVGAGNATPTISARLHVRGDGINAVAIFQNSAGTAGIAISSDALTLSVRNYQIGNNSNLIQAFAGAPDPNGSAILYTSIATTAQLYAHNFVSGTRANLTGTSGQLNISGGFAAGAGSGNFRLAGIEYTINNSGAQTGTATGIFLRSTETNLNGMLHNFIDLGTIALGSLFSVANNGAIRVATIADSNAPISSLYFSSTANKLVWKDAGGVVNNLY